jgi:Family of unknown function (DUF6059)
MAERVAGLLKALRRGLRRVLLRDGRHLAHVAWTYNPMWLCPEVSGPPPGHPERIPVDVPMSEVERGLWAQLSR